MPGVGETVARQVGTKLGLMVDLEEKAKMHSFDTETFMVATKVKQCQEVCKLLRCIGLLFDEYFT